MPIYGGLKMWKSLVMEFWGRAKRETQPTADRYGAVRRRYLGGRIGIASYSLF